MLPLHQSSVSSIVYYDNKKARNQPCSNMVGTERLELSHLAALEPKSSASTNFATSPLNPDLYIKIQAVS